MAPTVLLALLVLLAQIPVWRKRGARFMLRSAFASSLRSVFWGVASTFAAIGELLLVLGAVENHGHRWIIALPIVGGALLGSWWLSGAWLLALARRGTVSPRTLYILGQLFFVFARTDETVPGSLLLAALTLARGRGATGTERAWLWTKLRAQKRGLGTFAVATAVTFLLEARAARDEKQLTAATEATLLARALLGTVSYATRMGAPGAVRRLASDLHALVSAEVGDWGFVAVAEEPWLSDDIRSLRAVVVARMGDPSRGAGAGPVPLPPMSPAQRLAYLLRRALARLRSRRPAAPSVLAQTLEARFDGAKAPPAELPFETAHLEARAIHAALSRGEHLAPGEHFLLLAVFDVLLSPDRPQTVIPEAMRAAEDAVAAMQDDVSFGLARLLVSLPPPLGSVKTYGPISARVHAVLESILQTELHTCCERVNRRLKESWRGTAYEEWMEATKLRLAFRRLEQGLGTPAARQAWALYASAAVRLGVSFSETLPRRRPLAHCIFHSLYNDAYRFGDVPNMRQQAHNMRVTS